MASPLLPGRLLTTPPPLSANALSVLRSRYLRRSAETREPVETPGDLYRRVARSVAAAEARWPGSGFPASVWEDAFESLMTRGIFLPNSPTLMNAGREAGMLSACFVLPLEDDLGAIFETLRQAALVQKAGGGTGFDFSPLRPHGDPILTSTGSASGPVSFLKVFSAATGAIQQGSFRRGANMGVLRIDHPDILLFLAAKQDPSELTNFNLSVAVTDEFLAELGTRPDGPHLVVHPSSGRRSTLSRADRAGAPWTRGELFDQLVEQAWASGEPGLLFLDAINRDNPTPALGRIVATNPCSEQPLLPHEACTLGSIRLSAFVRLADLDLSLPLEPRPELFDWEGLRSVARVATRFLDDVIEINGYPVPEIEARCRETRKIGLGVMGFADTLFRLGLPYDSQEAARFGEQVMSTLNAAARAASEELASERGPFPAWGESALRATSKAPRRNAAITTIAPTGTISILADCSGGIEPLFSLSFERRILDGKRLPELSKPFLDVARARGLCLETILEHLDRSGSLQDLPEVPSDLRAVFLTARDIAPRHHLAMQAAFQRHCDSGVSKTINFSAAATREDVKTAFLTAGKLGLKGITVYRDGSRPGQPMSLPAATARAVACPGCG